MSSPIAPQGRPRSPHLYRAIADEHHEFTLMQINNALQVCRDLATSFDKRGERTKELVGESTQLVIKALMADGAHAPSDSLHQDINWQMLHNSWQAGFVCHHDSNMLAIEDKPRRS